MKVRPTGGGAYGVKYSESRAKSLSGLGLTAGKLPPIFILEGEPMKNKLNWLAIGALSLVVLAQLMIGTSRPASAFDGKVGSDSAAVSVATSADGMHVYICDPKHCYASHDAAKTFVKLKVD